jgi:uncharacterized repeat protein (TIGR01451 family)
VRRLSSSSFIIAIIVVCLLSQTSLVGAVTHNNPPDLSVELELNTGQPYQTVQPDGVLIYKLFGTNYRPGILAKGVTLIERVPAFTTFDRANSTTGWSCPNKSPEGTICLLKIKDLDHLRLYSAYFAVRVLSELPDTARDIVNTAQIDYDHAEGPDVYEENNRATLINNIDHANLNVTLNALLSNNTSISKRAAAGDEVQFEITGRNIGSGTAYNVTVMNNLSGQPIFLVIPSAKTDTGYISLVNTSSIHVAIGDLAPQQSFRITYNVRVVSPLPTSAMQIKNTALISRALGDSTISRSTNTTCIATTNARQPFCQTAFLPLLIKPARKP